MKQFLTTCRSPVFCCLMAALCIQYALAWGTDGHKMVNRVAMEMLPADMPEFLRTPQALDQVEYLGPEPDRWRSAAERELSVTRHPIISLNWNWPISPHPVGCRICDTVFCAISVGLRGNFLGWKKS
ncbi:MAG: hypothetical protein ABI164_06290 [Acidobacteriaceae bacterium]